MELLNKRKANVGYVYNQIKICEGILYKSFFCESHITGIPFSGTNANVITAELKKKGINCLRYNKYWWFVPKELRETFKSEKEFHDNHFLVPVTENFNSETLDYLVKALKDLSPQME